MRLAKSAAWWLVFLTLSLALGWYAMEFLYQLGMVEPL